MAAPGWGSSPEVDAVFACNDQMALGALKTTRELSLQVPEDLAIVGYDGRARVLRETAKSMKLDDDVVPGEGELEERIASNMQAQAMGAPAGGGGSPSVKGLGEENKLMPDLQKMAQH